MIKITQLLLIIFLFTSLELFAQAPVITNPTNQTVDEGQTATFSVSVISGTEPIGFQWQISLNGTGTDWTNITGANSNSYTTISTTISMDGIGFRCVASNDSGTVNSSLAILNVNPLPPQIGIQPSNQNVNEGQTANFSVTVIGGTEPFSYQWQTSVSGTGTDWANIPGATSNSFTTVSTTIDMNGDLFRCNISNAAASVSSSSAILTVAALAPQIISQPSDQSIFVGETATFEVVATSSISVNYQWYAEDIAIPGATDSVYTTDPIDDLTLDGTVLYCVITNASGSVQSSNAILNVSLPEGRVSDGLQVLYNFQEGTGTVINDVSGVGSPYNLTINTPSAVNWTNDGLDIINSSNIKSNSAAAKIIDQCKITNEITIEMWLRPANVVQGEKTARILSCADSKSERNFVVAQPYTVYDVPVRTTETDLAGHPQVWGEDAVSTSLTHFVYTRKADGEATLYINGVEFAGNTAEGDFSNWNGSYVLGLANEINDATKSWQGSFYLVAIYSKALELFEISHNFNVGVPLDVEEPNIKMNPRYQGALVGESKEFRTGAVGELPMTYQWQVDEGSGFTDISGATKSFYRTSPVNTGFNKNDYRCRITNSKGTATSSFATLYVTAGGSKVTVNKQVEYKFQEGSGTVINDVSSLGDPLNLTIEEPSAVEWTPYGINITDVAGIVSNNPATKLIDASKISHEYSFEAWIKPSEESLSKLSRIVAISSGSNSRNFLFAQNNNSYELRSRTTINFSGSQSLESDVGTVNANDLNHIAFTVNEFGMRKLFINGVEVESSHSYGKITNWDNSYLLSIGGDVDNSYSWEGLVNYMAFYGRGLSPTEINHNYSFGVEGGVPTIIAPTGMTLDAIGSNSVMLSWTDNSDNESGFVVERSVGDSSSFVQIDSVESNSTTYLDSTISESMVYFYRLKAYNVAAQSEYSNQIEVVSLLNEPTNLTAQAQIFGEIILRWDENSELEEGIIIERGEGEPLVYSEIDTVQSNVNSYFDQTVGDLVDYSYRVYAFNSTSASEYSNTVNITSLFADINTPSDLAVNLHSILGVPELNWSDNSENENGFTIERKIAGAEYIVIDTVDTDSTYYLDNSVDDNTIYLYRVMAFNDNTSSGYSNVVDVSVLTSIQDMELPVEFGLAQNYPNPFNPSTTIKFDLPEQSHVNLTVYNMLGEQVTKLVNRDYSAGRYEFKFDASELTSGIYIYSIKANGVSGNDFVSTKKMLLIK